MKDDQALLDPYLGMHSTHRILCSGRQVGFLASNMMQDAIIRNFEIIGEATKHLSPELRQSHPEIQWRGLAGFRDVLIHNYMGVDLDEIWNIIENELPQIKSSLEGRSG